jgi:ABC-type antimicrobial peptide transport system permease subunit
MKNVYLVVLIMMLGIILFLTVQNMLKRQMVLIFFSVAPAAAMGLIMAVCGFIAGICAVLYYRAWKEEKNDEDEEI